MKDTKLNLNPKRLITFQRRMINHYKSQIEIARKDGEYDYVVWLTNIMEHGKTLLDKKINGMNRLSNFQSINNNN